jgi:hypothetical protein
MDENRKRAYRYLLYHFLITIRKTPTENPAKSLTDEQCRRYINYAGATAYLLHNLALLGADDFEGFNEEAFWDALDNFSQRCPETDISHIRRVFVSQLLNNSND